MRREARACQGATESGQAAKRKVCSHWEHLAGILQTVAVVTHHNEATEQQGKTTSREGLAFSFQNKMGQISGQGCTYQGSYPQLIPRLCSFEFSQKIFPDTGTKNSGLLQQSMSNISPSGEVSRLTHKTWSLLSSLCLHRNVANTFMSPPPYLMLRLHPICFLSSKWL